MNATPRFAETFCSNCGGSFGPGDHGFSHCRSHKGRTRSFRSTTMRTTHTLRVNYSLAVLREALVWAADEGALRLIPAEFHPLFEPARLRPVKSPPGFEAVLVGKHDGVEVRARLTTGGRELHLQVDIPPRAAQRTRVRLPAEFVVKPAEIPTREAA
jgi:hypothetical protein